MSDFALRYGFIEPRLEVQDTTLDVDTRRALWNLTYAYFERLNVNSNGAMHLSHSSIEIWEDYLGYNRDEHRDRLDTFLRVKAVLQDSTIDAWYVLQFFAYAVERDWFGSLAPTFSASLNALFEKYMVGWRVIDAELMRLESEHEVRAVDDALAATRGVTAYEGVYHHIKSGAAKLSDLNRPDYPNSAKESISAVEAMVEHITGENLLSKGLKKLAAAGLDAHPALLAGWDKFYAWAGDEGGVRHSTKKFPNVDQATARFFLVNCAAFVTYLIDKSRKSV